MKNESFKYIKKIFLFVIMVFISNIILSQPLQKITVILDWFINPDHAPLLVAQQQGFFKQAGLNVQFIMPADSSDPPKLVAAGKADIALDYQPHLLMEMSNGLPVRQVGALIDKPLTCMAVLADSKIYHVKDLKGKRIGYSLGGISSATLATMLKSVGLSLNDVQLINVHYGLTQALLAHRVDAIIGVMRNFELIELKLAGHPARAFYPEDYGFPSYNELVFITQTSRTHDLNIQKFLTAVKLATAYLKAHPQQSWQAAIKEWPQLNNSLNKEAWFETIPYFANNPSEINYDTCKHLANYLSIQLEIKIPEQACFDNFYD